jgi:hypothetical protein
MIYSFYITEENFQNLKKLRFNQMKDMQKGKIKIGRIA